MLSICMSEYIFIYFYVCVCVYIKWSEFVYWYVVKMINIVDIVKIRILFLFFLYFGWLINGKNCFLEWNIIIYYYDLFSDILLNFKIIGWF